MVDPSKSRWSIPIFTTLSIPKNERENTHRKREKEGKKRERLISRLKELKTMADQTGAAVDTLLNLLATAIKDEAQLLQGIQGDMQFINDEMNGCLTTHQDGVRA
jgi:hypothetical protein